MKLLVRSRVLEQLFLQIARSQRAFDGATVEVQPAQVIVPGMVMPQALAGPLQALPRGMLAGVTALQVPLQPIVPEFVEPQLFGADQQPPPSHPGLAGVTPVQAPAQLMVPQPCAPQAFGADQQPVPKLAEQHPVADGS